MKYRWVDKRLLLLLHDESLAEHGGSSGIRDVGLLESALARPHHLLDYASPDVFDLAGSYVFGWAKLVRLRRGDYVMLSKKLLSFAPRIKFR